MRRALAAAACAAGLAAAGAAAGAPSSADRGAASRGAAWIGSQPLSIPAGQQADAIIALRAAGTPPRSLRPRVRALARAGRGYGTTAGRAAKVARGAMAVGANPARFGRVNYIGRINRTYRAGRYGTTAYDQALAIIALREAGRPVPRRAILALARARGRDGWGLGLTRSAPDDVDATAIVIEALRSAGLGRGNRGLRAATRWLRAQKTRGGYPSRPGRQADANSTAAVLRALNAMRSRGRADASAALRAHQRPGGRFVWRQRQSGSDLLATLDAVPALLGAGT